MDEIKNGVISLIARIKGDETIINEINDESQFAEDLMLDSIEIITLILEVEEVLNRKVDFDKLNYTHLINIKTFCEFLENECEITA